MTLRKKRTQSSDSQLTNDFVGKTEGQREYIRCLLENEITFCTGVAGSGKSMLALGVACRQLVDNRVSRIVIARPAIEASPRGIGYLKGSLEEKISPYLAPAIEHLKHFLGVNRYHNYLRDEVIKFEAVEYMRGKTFDYSWIIVEESQNLTTDQIKMVVSRIGEGSRMCLNGDTDQTDLKHKGEESDLQYVIDKITAANIEGFGFHQMFEADVVRNRLITPFLRALK